MFLGGNTIIPQGGAEVITLDREELALIAATKGDGYYKDIDFWKEVLVTFQKTGIVGAQRKALCYEGTNTAQLSFSSTAMTGEWEIREVVIMDKDRGSLVLKRADIPNVELYDLTITTA